MLFIPGKQFTVRLLTNCFMDKCNLRSLWAFLDAMISHMCPWSAASFLSADHVSERPLCSLCSGSADGGLVSGSVGPGLCAGLSRWRSMWRQGAFLNFLWLWGSWVVFSLITGSCADYSDLDSASVWLCLYKHETSLKVQSASIC